MLINEFSLNKAQKWETCSGLGGCRLNIRHAVLDLSIWFKFLLNTCRLFSGILIESPQNYAGKCTVYQQCIFDTYQDQVGSYLSPSCSLWLRLIVLTHSIINHSKMPPALPVSYSISVIDNIHQVWGKRVYINSGSKGLNIGDT